MDTEDRYTLVRALEVNDLWNDLKRHEANKLRARNWQIESTKLLRKRPRTREKQ